MEFLSLNQHLQEIYGCRVHRVVVDAGFTCPNRDGKIGYGGCLYCSEEGARATYCKPSIPINEQVERGIKFMRRRYLAKKFIVYFQPFTNTYAPVDTLKDIYDQSLANPEIVGMTIGTRPDCIPDETLDLISSYNDKYYVLLELGLQSGVNKNLEYIKRGHTVEDFIDAVKRAKSKNIKICAHIIIGLPYDTKETIMQTAHLLKELGIDGVKIHSLYINHDSRLADDFKNGKIILPTMEEYISTTAEFIKILGKEVVIHRLASDVNPEKLLAPKWALNKDEIVKRVRDY